ncbi:MAG: DNA-binding protein [Proteobacteria bacterium]|nr:DNA-binding protein [Pseudomonadota bacterium]
MPEKKTIEKARKDKREGKSPSTQAGEFVHAEIDKIRKGRHGARSAKQAIAIGLSEARRSGVDLPPPKKGRTSAATQKKAKYALDVGQGRRKATKRPSVARAVSNVLKKEPHGTVSRKELSKQTRKAASRRTTAERSASARKAARTKGAAERSAAAKKAAATRRRRGG